MLSYKDKGERKLPQMKNITQILYVFSYVENSYNRIFIANTLLFITKIIITVDLQPNVNDLFNLLHIVKRV